MRGSRPARGVRPRGQRHRPAEQRPPQPLLGVPRGEEVDQELADEVERPGDQGRVEALPADADREERRRDEDAHLEGDDVPVGGGERPAHGVGVGRRGGAERGRADDGDERDGVAVGEQGRRDAAPHERQGQHRHAGQHHQGHLHDAREHLAVVDLAARQVGRQQQFGRPPLALLDERAGHEDRRQDENDQCLHHEERQPEGVGEPGQFLGDFRGRAGRGRAVAEPGRPQQPHGPEQQQAEGGAGGDGRAEPPAGAQQFPGQQRQAAAAAGRRASHRIHRRRPGSGVVSGRIRPASALVAAKVAALPGAAGRTPRAASPRRPARPRDTPARHRPASRTPSPASPRPGRTRGRSCPIRPPAAAARPTPFRRRDRRGTARPATPGRGRRTTPSPAPPWRTPSRGTGRVPSRTGRRRTAAVPPGAWPPGAARP